eukprot:306390-Chlamydomonas_euryale.AAC.3
MQPFPECDQQLGAVDPGLGLINGSLTMMLCARVVIWQPKVEVRQKCPLPLFASWQATRFSLPESTAHAGSTILTCVYAQRRCNLYMRPCAALL